jgi:peptide/nickel transport system substrate-binding protein
MMVQAVPALELIKSSSGFFPGPSIIFLLVHPVRRICTTKGSLMKFVLSCFICAVVLFLLSTCGAPRQLSGEPEPVDCTAIQDKAGAFVPSVGTTGGEMVLSAFSDPRSFNPVTSTDMITGEFTKYIYEGLVHINTITLKPEPGLAESWKVSSDGLTWVFSIRPGVLWSDSVPFSAYDVEFTFVSLVLNDSINPNSSRDMFIIDGKKPVVKVLDSMTVQFTLPVPYAPLLRAMAQEILPRHKYEKFVKDNSFSGALGVLTSPDSMVGTGPFLLQTCIPSQKVVFKRNPLYWKKDTAGNRLPYLSRIVYAIVLDQKAELARFKRAEIDYMKVKGEDYAELARDQTPGKYTLYRLGPASGSYFVFFNQNTLSDPATGKPYVDSVKLSWFRCQKFRQGIAFALDKPSMVREVMNGLGYPQSGPMSPSEGYYYTPDVTTYAFDTAKAKSTLAEAGFTDRNKDGVIEDSSGHPVDFALYTNSGNTVRNKLAEIITKNLAVIGIKVHFQHLEFGNLTDRIDNPPFAWDAALLALTGNVEPHFGKNVWQSSGYLHMWFPGEKAPSTPWEARIDSIFSAGSRELDESKRKALYDEWQRIAADQVPFIYTVLPEQIFCISNRFRNVNPSVTGGLLHDIEWIFVGGPASDAAQDTSKTPEKK